MAAVFLTPRLAPLLVLAGRRHSGAVSYTTPATHAEFGTFATEADIP